MDDVDITPALVGEVIGAIAFTALAIVLLVVRPFGIDGIALAVAVALSVYAALDRLRVLSERFGWGHTWNR